MTEHELTNYVPEPPRQEAKLYFLGTPDAIDKLAEAMALAMADFLPIVNADEGQQGNRRFKYASLDLLRGATMPALLKRRILVLQPLTGPYGVGEGGGQVYRLDTIVMGYGARMAAILEFERAGNLQEFGSQQTYLRRYAYRAFFLLDGSDDVDRGDTREGPRDQPPAQRGYEARPAQEQEPERGPVTSDQKSYSTQDIAALHQEIQSLLRTLGIREPKAMQAELATLAGGKEFARNPNLLIQMRETLRSREAKHATGAT